MSKNNKTEQNLEHNRSDKINRKFGENKSKIDWSLHSAESTNPEASTGAQVCNQGYDHTFSTHKLPEQFKYGDNENEKASPYLTENPQIATIVAS